MWKKDEEQPVRPTGAPGPTAETARAPTARSAHATIGPSIVIRGEVSGSEDLLIQGQVDGSVSLDLHAVTIGGGGRVKADVSGRVIVVEGDLEGNLSAEEQIVLRGSAKVQGDLKAPRVVLEDGASYRGMVDMGPPKDAGKPAPASGGEPRRADARKSEPAAASVGAVGAGKKPERRDGP